MRKILFWMLVTLHFSSVAQYGELTAKDWKTQYRATDERINDVVHAKIEARFDYARSYLYGKVWLTIKPHFYATDSLKLDAKGMTVKAVGLIRKKQFVPLKYEYDNMNLRIRLGRNYTRRETYQIYVAYTAKPNEYKGAGSAAIQDAKGLYFINPLGTEKNKPTQIWTQGETEATSVWVPIIDKPNQKCTEEISMTVPAKYVTLSNGRLVSQRSNNNGTRTDHWKMELPHSPYLFFMGVGDFAVVKDRYKGKEVSYYVEKEFRNVARKIFGETPAMISFFSKVLGVEYPWIKYSQIVGRDYVSGAMENTTATLHREALQQNARQLVDGNAFEEYISHELFHQWFGDLVTAESWSNLTVNESMANYSEVLWDDYRYGKDFAAAKNYQDMQDYLVGRGSTKDLVRFFYSDKEEMFDLVSYNKGGRIQHMLRNFIGDSAYFKGLNRYLTQNKFNNTEATQLRLAMEEVSGKDLNWFWNQWYFGSGHPRLELKYDYDFTGRQAAVYIKQTQAGDKVFRLPVAVDVYTGGRKTRYYRWLNNREDTLRFTVNTKPDLINVDADKVLLAEKKDLKTAAEFLFQYRYAGNYVDRREALDFAIREPESQESKLILTAALNDRAFQIKEKAIKAIKPADASEAVTEIILQIATTDSKRSSRAVAIDYLARKKEERFKPVFLKAVFDSSYTVAGAGLEALLAIDEAAAISRLPQIRNDVQGRLENAVELAEALTKTDDDFSVMTRNFDSAQISEKFTKYRTYLVYIGRVNNANDFVMGIEKVISFRNSMSAFSPQLRTTINQQLELLKAKKEKQRAGNKADEDLRKQVEYLDKVIKSK